MAIKTVAVIGTGIMGAPIARHLMDAGYTVYVYNRTPERAQALVDAGATWVDTPATAAKVADVVFTMVGLPADVEEVYLGQNGLATAARPGTFWIDLTTSAIDLAQEIAELAETYDVTAFDCPVTGGQAGAEAGTLTLIAGATQETVAPVYDVLMTFGSTIFYFDKPGAGQAAKLCNQISLASSMVGMADAFAFASANDLDVSEVMTMITSGMGETRAMTALGPKALAQDYAPGFKIEHLFKDLACALTQAEELGLELSGTMNAFELYGALTQIGGGELGTQAIGLINQDPQTLEAMGLNVGAFLDSSDDECECGHAHGDGHECSGHHHHHH